jgi:PAS domain S-box-containing protein
MSRDRKIPIIFILILLPLLILAFCVIDYLREANGFIFLLLVPGLLLSVCLWLVLIPILFPAFFKDKVFPRKRLLKSVGGGLLKDADLALKMNEALLMNKVIGTATSTLEPQVICETVCREVALVLNVPQAALALLDHSQDALIVSAEYREEGRPSAIGDVIPIAGNPIAQYFMETRSPIIVNKVRTDSRFQFMKEVMARRGIVSIMIIPLFIRDELIGTLGLDAIVERDFTQEEALLAQNVATAVGQVIEIARLYDNLRIELDYRQIVEDDLARRERYLTALVEIHGLLLSAKPQDQVHPRILRVIGPASGASRAYIYKNFMGDHGNLLSRRLCEWVSTENQDNGLNSTEIDISLDRLGRWKEILDRGEILEGMVGELPETEKHEFPFFESGCFIILPIRVASDFWGFIGFEIIQGVRPWSSFEAMMLKTVASTIAMSEERRIAEIELSDQRDFALQIMNNMGQGLMVIDPMGKFEFVNPALANMLGCSPGDFIGKTMIELSIPDSMNPISNSPILKLRGSVISNEVRFERSDGSLVYTLFTGVPFWHEGEVGGSIVVVTDVTERKNVEDALRKNEEFMRGMYNITSAQDLYFTDKILALLVLGTQFFNTEGAALVQSKKDAYQVVEMYSTFSDSKLDNNAVLRQTYYLDAMRSGELIAFENAGQSDWAYHPAYLDTSVEAYLCMPIFVNGEVYGAICFFSYSVRNRQFSASDKEFIRLMAQWIGGEIERDQFVDQMQKYSDEIVLKNQALSEARDQALEASRLKSEFLATMSHEIRTPMNAVIGMAELLLDTPMNRDQREYTTIIQDSAQVLLTLINDILDFSKIEAGKLQLETLELNPAEVVDNVIEMFIPKAREKKLQLMAYVAPEIPRIVLGDSVRLQQVLINLIGNAIKFTSRGEVVVRVDLESETDTRVKLNFQVHDTGIGLSLVARRRLFQPFTQADGSTTRKYGGTGLGLAISKRMVELMGGEIGVESVENEGSTFWFTMPLEKITMIAQPFMGRSPLEGRRALVIDSNRSHGEILVNYLQAWKLQSEHIQNGGEVEKVLEKSSSTGKPFDFAIVDSEILGSDGYEIGKQISSHHQVPAVRMILMTAFDQQELGENALAAGFIAYLTKPIQRDRLQKTLIRTLFGEDLLVNENVGSCKEITSPNDAPALPVTLPDEENQDQNRLVLLAEDNLANQKLTTAQLSKLGYRVEVVASGDKAVDEVLTNPEKYRLVLMDCQMPDLDGFAATRLIRVAEEKSGLHIPIIALTANAMEGDRETCISAGMDDYLSKPIKLLNLRGIIEKWGGPQGYPAVQPRSSFNRSGGPVSNSLDYEVIASIRDLQVEGEPDFFINLVNIYLKDSVHQIERIRAAILDSNSEELRKAAHTLKGTSTNLGARILSSYCAELESIASEGKMESVTKWLDRLEAEYREVCNALGQEQRKI